MAGFTTYADLIAEAYTNGKSHPRHFEKTTTSPEASGVWHSAWTAAGSPAAGANPATTPGTAYDDTAGSIFFPDEASDKKFIARVGAIANIQSLLCIYDRLVGVSGISLASTGNKTINSAALPRYTGTDAENVECWLEVSTATTVTAPIVNLSQYTNEAGTTGRAGGNVTFPAVATNIDAMIGPLPLQAGDKGIRSIEVGLNVGTAASAGVCNVLLLRRLATIQLPSSIWVEQDFVLQLPTLPRVFDGASLAFMIMTNNNAAVLFQGELEVVYG
jgi:hypothetical protein